MRNAAHRHTDGRQIIAGSCIKIAERRREGSWTVCSRRVVFEICRKKIVCMHVGLSLGFWMFYWVLRVSASCFEKKIGDFLYDVLRICFFLYRKWLSKLIVVSTICSRTILEITFRSFGINQAKAIHVIRNCFPYRLIAFPWCYFIISRSIVYTNQKQHSISSVAERSIDRTAFLRWKWRSRNILISLVRSAIAEKDRAPSRPYDHCGIDFHFAKCRQLVLRAWSLTFAQVTLKMSSFAPRNGVEGQWMVVGGWAEQCSVGQASWTISLECH